MMALNIIHLNLKESPYSFEFIVKILERNLKEY